MPARNSFTPSQPWVSNHLEAQALEGRQKALPPFQGS